jgi:putative acetyltransferase
MVVRDFTELDFPAVCSIYIEAKSDELQFEKGAVEITPLDEDTVILAAFKESALLIIEDKEVLAFAALYGNQLRAMFVRRDVRGNGVGQALLEPCVQRLMVKWFLTLRSQTSELKDFTHATALSRLER